MRVMHILLTNIAASRGAMLAPRASTRLARTRPWRRCASMSAAAPPVTIDMVAGTACKSAPSSGVAMVSVRTGAGDR